MIPSHRCNASVNIAHVVEIATARTLWDTVAYIVASLFRRHVTTLVFLPGKAEITKVHDALVAMQVSHVDDLHSELDELVIKRAKLPTVHTRCTPHPAEYSKAQFARPYQLNRIMSTNRTN